MAEGRNKKAYIMYILEILKKYSDANHPLKQKDIVEYLKKDYDAVVDRKTVARNLNDLEELGYEIEREDGIYLLSRTFEDSELRLLIDSVLASKYIPGNQAKDLIERLAGQSSIYFRKQVKHISNVGRMEHTPSQLFYTVEMLSEAIDQGRKVRFFYNRYDESKALTHTSEEKRLVNPYQIVIANGRYYLIGNVDKYDNSTHFRVEKISDMEITDLPVKDIKRVEEFKNGLDLPKHMAEHVYMFSGKSEMIRLKVNRAVINDCIDWLGKDIVIMKENDDTFLIDVTANPEAMKYWAIQFGQNVEIVLPERLRQETAEIAESIWNKYKGEK